MLTIMSEAHDGTGDVEDVLDDDRPVVSSASVAGERAASSFDIDDM